MGRGLEHAATALLALAALAPGRTQARLAGPPGDQKAQSAEPAPTRQAAENKPGQTAAPKPPEVAAPKPTKATAPKPARAPAKAGQATAPNPTKTPAQGAAPKPTQDPAGADKTSPPKGKGPMPARKPEQATAPKPDQAAKGDQRKEKEKGQDPGPPPTQPTGEKPDQDPFARIDRAFASGAGPAAPDGGARAQRTEKKPARAAEPKQAKAPARGDQGAAKKPAQKPADKPAQRPADRPAQKPAGKTAQKPAQKPPAKPAQKPRPAQKTSPMEPPPPFLDTPAVLEFINRMAALHGFDADELTGQFSVIGPNMRVLALFRPDLWRPAKKPPQPPSQPSQPPRKAQPKPPTNSWAHHSATFLSRRRIEGGVRFWRENAAALERARDQYGVPPEIVVAIIGVETMYGEQKGGFRVMEALASLAFHDPRRGDFFLEELENFLLLSRENGLDPLKVQGSYAGAIGIPQFMPKSWRRFAVDFDGDGVVDLENSFADSIGSVASYLKEYGWRDGEPVAHRAALDDKPKPAWASAGMLPALSVKELKADGVRIEGGDRDAPELATFIELPAPGRPTDYWLGYGNYYAITRYNRSHYYSMAVFMLAEEIRALLESDAKL